MAKYVCKVCGYIAEGSIPEKCPVCKAPASAFVEKVGNEYVTEHVVGIAKSEDVPQDIVDGLRANFEGECSEVGMYLAMSRVAERETGPSWKLLDTGEIFTWISNEHCMLMVGYDEEGYYFNDPYDGNGVIRYPKDVVKDRYQAQHMQAVAVRNSNRQRK